MDIQENEVQIQEDSQEVIIVDEQNNEIGKATRKEMREKNLIHRATYIFVFQKGLEGFPGGPGKLFCHMRSSLKRYCPSYFDACFGGVVEVGETYDSNAKKELAEEAGLNCPLAAVSQFFYKSNQARVWGMVYYAEFDGEVLNLVPQAEEVEFVELMTIEEIKLRSSTGDPFTPDGLMALDVLVEKLNINL